MAQKTVPPPPESVETRCATCREDTEHEVLKGKVVKGGLGLEGTFKCYECETIHTGLITFPAPVELPFIVSIGEEAEPFSVQLLEDDQVAVGDEFEIEENLVEVTAVELKDQGRRVRRAKATDIMTLWGKNINQIRVGFALNVGARTMSFEADFGPEEEIGIGDEFEYEDGDVVVERIVTDEGKRFSGAYNVRQIKRVWVTPKKDGRPAPRAPRPAPGDAPRGQKAQRQAARARDTARRPGGPRPHGRPKRGPSTSGGGSGARSGPRTGGPGAQRSGGGGSGRGPPRGGAGGGSREGGRSSGGPRSGGRTSEGGRSSGGPRSGGRSSGGPRGGGRSSGGPRGGSGGPRSGGRGPGPSRGGSGGGPRSGGRGPGPSRGGSGGRGGGKGPGGRGRGRSGSK